MFLPLTFGHSDLIDMEPSYGDVYKMFLGSLDPKWDSRANVANNLVPFTPVQSPSSASRPIPWRGSNQSETGLLSPTSSIDSWIGGSESQGVQSTDNRGYPAPEGAGPRRDERSPARHANSTPAISPSFPRMGSLTHRDRDTLERSVSTRSSAEAGGSTSMQRLHSQS